MELGALPGVERVKYITESDSLGNKTNQEPEYPLRARIVKVVDGQNHCEGGGKPCVAGCAAL
jgi:hypothetical protein